MTIQDVKQIKLADYLQSLGYTPVKQQGRNLWYKSPLREETDASFKVNTELEKWYDFGSGKGGNIIALAAELYHSEDVAYLLRRIEERTPYIRPVSFSFGRQHSDNQPYQGLRISELSSPALTAYLQERGISSVICTFAFPKVFRQKYHSSIGRFLHALLRNAKNTLSSQREIPLETLCKREQKPNSFGLCRVQQGFICIINPVSRCHRQREET